MVLQPGLSPWLEMQMSCICISFMYLCSKQVWWKYHEELWPEHEEFAVATFEASYLAGALARPSLVAPHVPAGYLFSKLGTIWEPLAVS